MNTQKVQNVQQKECNIGFLKRNTTSLQGYGHKILLWFFTPSLHGVFHVIILSLFLILIFVLPFSCKHKNTIFRIFSKNGV